MKTRAQDWSKYAYQRVANADQHGNANRDSAKYRTSCNKMPGLIHQSGVLQALVFQCARDKTGQLYVDHLAQTLFQDPRADRHKIIDAAQRAGLQEYLGMTRDVASIAQWFARFAQIELSNVDGERRDG